MTKIFHIFHYFLQVIYAPVKNYHHVKFATKFKWLIFFPITKFKPKITALENIPVKFVKSFNIFHLFLKVINTPFQKLPPCQVCCKVKMVVTQFKQQITALENILLKLSKLFNIHDFKKFTFFILMC
jgi:hypothetical protein